MRTILGRAASVAAIGATLAGMVAAAALTVTGPAPAPAHHLPGPPPAGSVAGYHWPAAPHGCRYEWAWDGRHWNAGHWQEICRP